MAAESNSFGDRLLVNMMATTFRQGYVSNDKVWSYLQFFSGSLALFFLHSFNLRAQSQAWDNFQQMKVFLVHFKISFSSEDI